MGVVSSAEEYCYAVRWSVEDDAFVGTVAEFPSLSWLGESRDAALRGLSDLVEQVLSGMAADGETPPVPQQAS